MRCAFARAIGETLFNSLEEDGVDVHELLEGVLKNKFLGMHTLVLRQPSPK
jgi:hypothetical protein